MGILKKFLEFRQEGGEEILSKVESPISDELRNELNKLKEKFRKQQKAEIEYGDWKISLPSELNGEGQEELTYLIISADDEHAQSQSEQEIADYTSGKILRESLSFKKKRR